MTMLVLLLMTANISAQLSPSYAHKKLTIGDPFEVILTLKYDAAESISGPYADSLTPFVILDTRNKIVQEKGTVTSTYRLRTAAFSTGDLMVPPIRFLVKRDTIVDTLSSDPVKVTIASVLPAGMKDINDLKPAVEFPNYALLVIMALTIGIAALGIIGSRLWKNIRRSRVHAEPPVPPWDEALKAIDALPWQEWTGKGLVKKYYYALTEIIKRYLERRFEFSAAEQTTTEILHNLKLRGVGLRDNFGAFFTRADLIKYAKVMPPGEELARAVIVARDLVNGTKPQTEKADA
ncbi:MAG TPA: hypothetical protein VF399_12820 [bacterium]